MNLEDAMTITHCPPEAWERSGRKGGMTRMPYACRARARVYAAMRCNWRRSEEGSMGLLAITKAAGLGHHSSIIQSLRGLCGSTEPAACRAWLDEWAKGGVAQ
jgi:hypothetical protein